MLPKQIKKKIKYKLIVSIWMLLTITFLFSFIAAQISMSIIKKRSEKQLVEQAISSAEYYSSGQAETINEKVKSISQRLEHAANYIEYIYDHKDEFSPKNIVLTDDYPDGTEGNTLHWIPFTEEDLSNPDVVSEAQLLASVEPELKAIMDTDAMVSSLYIATLTHVNVAYDGNVMQKKGAGFYNPEALKKSWYINTIDKGSTYIADTYFDEYGRGLMITIATPYFVDGSLRGILAGDIVIQAINESVLDMGISDGTAMLFSNDMKPICYQGMENNYSNSELLGTVENVNIIRNNEKGYMKTKIGGQDVYVVYNTIEETEWNLVIVLSVDTILEPAKVMTRVILYVNIILIVLTIGLFIIMMFLTNRFGNKIANPIIKLTEKVSDYKGSGVIQFEKQFETGDEIQELCESFVGMTESLQEYINDIRDITSEKERIGAELGVATRIQSSMLPSEFPNRPEFELYATMNPAKEVGGDFYDFFMVDRTHLAIVISDVSGKGVPAALFMVIGKTLIKDNTQPDRDLGEVFTNVNNLLCEANSQGLFITAFEGVLDLVTGEFNYVNAGHEMPFIAKAGEKFKPHKIKAGFVLAGMEGIKYKAGSIMLSPGDKLFEYTDGVTEATTANNELYGMERLESILGETSQMAPKDILPIVKLDIDNFVGDAPQFDDITMICFEYKQRMEDEIKLRATIENIQKVIDYVSEKLDQNNATNQAKMQVCIAIDEIMSNIANYGYEGREGDVSVCVDIQNDIIRLRFTDSGIRYDPLAKDDPDVTLSAEERKIGGLGIYMVKKTMDSVDYKYVDNKNILSISKKIK